MACRSTPVFFPLTRTAFPLSWGKRHPGSPHELSSPSPTHRRSRGHLLRRYPPRQTLRILRATAAPAALPFALATVGTRGGGSVRRELTAAFPLCYEIAAGPVDRPNSGRIPTDSQLRQAAEGRCVLRRACKPLAGSVGGGIFGRGTHPWRDDAIGLPGWSRPNRTPPDSQ